MLIPNSETLDRLEHDATQAQSELDNAMVEYEREFGAIAPEDIPAARLEFEQLHANLASEGKIAATEKQETFDEIVKRLDANDCLKAHCLKELLELPFWIYPYEDHHLLRVCNSVRTATAAEVDMWQKLESLYRDLETAKNLNLATSSSLAACEMLVKWSEEDVAKADGIKFVDVMTAAENVVAKTKGGGA